VKHQRRRPTRLIAGVLGGALALSASPLIGVQVAGAADPLPPLANPTASGAFCDDAPTTNPFMDLGGETASTRQVIICLVATKVTTGTTATTYSPGGTVTRRQMAVFVKRLADLANAQETGSFELAPLPAYTGVTGYPDVKHGEQGAVEIGQLTKAKIIAGFPDGTFRPNAPVSRRQMAAFVNNLQKFLSGGTALSTDKDFFDDDAGDSGEANLNALAAVGIFQGDGQGRVFPGGPLLRRQMANILLRYAQVLQNAVVIESPFAPPSNATLAVTPRTALTRELAVEPSAADDRLYRASGLQAGVTYTIQLFPAANIQGTTTRVFTEDGTTDTADDGSVAADITVVKGATVVGADDNTTAQPLDGVITFTVDGSAMESIAPVVFRDADADGKLDLKADNTPVADEPFGVGAVTQYLPPEAASATGPFTVTAISAERDAFVSGGATYYLDTNDTYRYAGTAITKNQFNSMLSVGDSGTVTYSADPAGVSVFNMTGDQVTATATPSVAIVDDGPGNVVDDARISYTRVPTNSPGVTYSLQRATVADDGPDNVCGNLDDVMPVDGAFATVAATQAAGAAGVFVFSDNDLPAGCYTYRIRATSPVSLSAANSFSPLGEAAAAPPDTLAPYSAYAERTTNAGTNDFDAGDVITVVFSETMAAPAANASLRLEDQDAVTATVAEIFNGVNATFALNTDPVTVDGAVRLARTVLTITLTAPPTTYLLFAGTTPGLQPPADIIASTGITDTSSNPWNLGGFDHVVDGSP
jgi:hypothetical protein